MSWSVRLRRGPLPFLQGSRSYSIKGASHYDTLGLTRRASPKEIKESYIQLSKVHHPDSTEGSAEAFRVISDAYEVLSNPGSKRDYDATLSVSVPLNEEVFRRRKRPEAPPRHRNIQVDLSQERMERAWTAYKDRWDREEERWRELEKLKKEFRKDLDDLRANMHNMTPEERDIFLEGMRLFRRPEHYKQFRRGDHYQNFRQNHQESSSRGSEEHPFSGFTRDKAKQWSEKVDNMKTFYNNSEFLGENYSQSSPKSVKYDIDQAGEIFRISQRTVATVLVIFSFFFLFDSFYQNDIRKTNRFFLMEAGKKNGSEPKET
uniref:DnaJ homolog subfamily B member 9 n=1 Tax=Caligus clemensi TaxID=344056 RepID=C1C2B2_CALCM|nr:Chaperone protein dnaJ [Caligus clemensi]